MIVAKYGKVYTMFIDESGTANGDGPFTVTGVIFDNKYAYSEDKTKVTKLARVLSEFKVKHFERDDFIFHMKDIVNAGKPFRSEDGVTRQQLASFWLDLPSFLSSLEFTIISVTVDKQKLKNYYINPKDPYIVAFAHIMQSFFSFINNETIQSARIVLESRDDYHDFIIQKAFFDIFNTGTVYMDLPEEIRNKIRGFLFVDKQNYEAGLEIADIICNPLSRVKRGLVELNTQRFKYGKTNRIFNSIKDKIYIGKKNHSIVDWGFKLVP